MSTYPSRSSFNDDNDDDTVRDSSCKSPSQPRHLARCCIVQKLYQWHFTQDAVEKMIAEQREASCYRQIDYKYFKQVLRGVILKINELDQVLQPYCDRPLNELNPVELAIMRLATYELQYRVKVPYKVALNEALELAKAFGAEQGHKYVNAILDKVVVQLHSMKD